MKHILRHKTTGYFAVIGEDAAHGFRHSPNEIDATRFDSEGEADTARRTFDAVSGTWMAVEVAA